ncbi:hypothetical protein [Marinobacter sp.]|uniref:hypothetical protein n=1 Tax=Marinobacter sp. TaxID=50741 RepID=UPI002618D2E7|nr:hypothetical protein [Marinobacter sp.]
MDIEKALKALKKCASYLFLSMCFLIIGISAVKDKEIDGWRYDTFSFGENHVQFGVAIIVVGLLLFGVFVFEFIKRIRK